MSHRTASRPAGWGPAAVSTIVILGALALGGATGLALFWTANTYDVGALAHTLTLTLTLAAIAAVTVFDARIGRRLVHAYRRPS